MSTREFTASVSKTLKPFVLLLCASIACGGLTWLSWDNALISGALTVFTGLLVFGSLILAYRLLFRPVMLRIGPEGLYLKRLGVTVPWDAIGRIERFTWNGSDTLFELVEAEGQHPIFDERALILGAAMNQKIGLPPLSVQMGQYSGTPEDFEAAVRAAGGPEITQGQDRALKQPTF
ncbi:MAG: hypothetical protein AAFQ22_01915 [Pseudomonadota bacterium]